MADTKERWSDESSRLAKEVISLWPAAPAMEVGGSGRWIRFDRPSGGAIYLQRYIWDEPCVPQFLVVTCGDLGVTDQWRFGSLPQAVAAVRSALG